MEKSDRKQTRNSEPLAYSVREVAKLTSLGVTTLYKLMKHGHLSYKKVGRRRLIPRAQLLALIEGEATHANNDSSVNASSED